MSERLKRVWGETGRTETSWQEDDNEEESEEKV